MSFWNSEHFRREPELIEPFKASLVKDCAYELRLGREAYVTSNQGVKTHLAEGEQFKIPPGQFALLLTEERLQLPNHVLGLISLRTRYKLRGLISVSGFHVDPGFEGHLIFSVYNAGGKDVIISRGESLFILWLAALEAPTKDLYGGTHKGQTSISNEDIMMIGPEQFSPAAMNVRLEKLEDRVSVWRNFAWVLAAGLAVMFIQQITSNPQTLVVPTPAPAPTVTVEVTPEAVTSDAPRETK